MTSFDVRMIRISKDEIRRERGPAPSQPLLVGTAAAVIHNPFAGRYEPDLLQFQSDLRELGRELASRLASELGGASRIESYGKGMIVGEDGELEHAAVWHEAGGWAMREALGQPKAIVPAAKTIGTLGTRLMIPLGHIHAAYVRSHFSTAELCIWDAPRRDELVYALVMATGGRINARVGGLGVQDISAHDGQR